jgi:hypothetical protein
MERSITGIRVNIIDVILVKNSAIFGAVITSPVLRSRDIHRVIQKVIP